MMSIASLSRREESGLLTSQYSAPQHTKSSGLAGVRDKRLLPASESPQRAKSKRLKVTHSNRKVKFTDPIVHTFDHSTDDKNLRWYQHIDYQEMKRDNRETIVQLHRANGRLSDLDTDKFCTRGLEPVIGALLLHIPANRQKKVVHAVLCMQQLMRATQKCDLEHLRAASTTISRHDNQKALNRASQDANHRTS